MLTPSSSQEHVTVLDVEPKAKRTLVVKVGGMSCAACSAAIQASIAMKIPECLACRVNVLDGRVEMDYEEGSVVQMMIKTSQAIESAGFSVSYSEDWRGRLQTRKFQSLVEFRQRRSDLLRISFFALPEIAIHVLNFQLKWLHTPQALLFELFLLAFPLHCWAAKNVYRRGFSQPRSMERLTTLAALMMLVSSGLQYSASRHLYLDCAASILFFFAMGRFAECWLKRSCVEADAEVLLPETRSFEVLRDGKWLVTGSLDEGDQLELTRNGEVVPCDSIVLSSNGMIVDESGLTGEALPQEKLAASQVFAGSLLVAGSGRVRVQRTLEKSLVGLIAQRFTDITKCRPQLELYANRIASLFIPCMLALSLGTFAVWLAIFLISGAKPEQILDNHQGASILATCAEFAAAVLTVSCPCALSLGTPVAVAIGRNAGKRKGLLLNDAMAIDRASQLTMLVFDKTGTLTQGKPMIRFERLDANTQHSLPELFDMLYQAESDANCNANPLGRAIADYCKVRGFGASLWILKEASEAEDNGCRGLHAAFEHTYNGSACHVSIGNELLMQSLELKVPRTATASSIAWVAIDGVLAGRFVCKDELRIEAGEALRSLRQRYKIGILSGDRQETVDALVRKLGTETFAFARGNCDPMQKAQHIKDLRLQGETVAFIGDGLNDALAMAEADLSISVPTGHGASIPSTSISLMRPDLGLSSEALKLATRVNRQIYANFWWASAYNCIALPMAVGLTLPMGIEPISPFTGPALMALSSVSVILASTTLFLQ